MKVVVFCLALIFLFHLTSATTNNKLQNAYITGTGLSCKPHEFVSKGLKCDKTYHHCINIAKKWELHEYTCPKNCCFNKKMEKCSCKGTGRKVMGVKRLRKISKDDHTLLLGKVNVHGQKDKKIIKRRLGKKGRAMKRQTSDSGSSENDLSAATEKSWWIAGNQNDIENDEVSGERTPTKEQCKNKFICYDSGIFPDHQDCRYVIKCELHDIWTQIRVDCGRHRHYSVKDEKCVDGKCPNACKK